MDKNIPSKNNSATISIYHDILIFAKKKNKLCSQKLNKCTGGMSIKNS